MITVIMAGVNGRMRVFLEVTIIQKCKIFCALTYVEKSGGVGIIGYWCRPEITIISVSFPGRKDRLLKVIISANVSRGEKGPKERGNY